MSVYTVHSLEKSNTHLKDHKTYSALPWQEAEEGRAQCFPWAASEESYKPELRFYLLYEKDTLYALLLTAGEDEKQPRCEVREHQGSVSKDSCLEFFLSCNPDKPDYINLESNSAAVMHAGFGPGRGNRLKLPKEELCGLNFTPVPSGTVPALDFAFDWGVFMEIPFALVKKFWPEKSEGFCSGEQFRANFYKCGDLCARPHYACWAKVDAPKPDYHRPESFGRLILE